MIMFPNRGLYLVAAVVGALAAFVAGSHHGCIHDTIRTLPGYGDTAPTINASYAVYTTIVNGRRFQATQSNFASMRIRLFFDQGDCAAGTCGHCQNVGDTVPTYESASSRTTCQADDVLTTAKKAYMMDRLMPAAASFLASALNVVRVSGNLVVSGGSTCGSAPGTVVPPSHQTTGVADADFVVYVTAAPRTDRESATVAWAGACRQDSAGRPVVAHVNFIPGKLTNAGSRQIQRNRRAQPANADDQHPAVEQPLLTANIDLLQQNLPAVTQQLLIIHAIVLRLPVADRQDRASFEPVQTLCRAATARPHQPAASRAQTATSLWPADAPARAAPTCEYHPARRHR